MGTVSASENVTDDVVAVFNDVAVDGAVSEVDLKDNSIAVENDDVSSSVLSSGEQLKDPELNLTVVRNGVYVSFDEENVTGFFTYYGDVEVNEFYNYTGEPYLIDMNGLPADDYPVHVKFVGNDKFTSASDTVYVSVEENDPEIKASLNGTVFTVEFNRNATDLNVIFDVYNDNYDREFTYGWEGGSCDPIVVDLSDLPVGNYSVEIASLPDDYYGGSEVLFFNLTVPGKQLKDPGLNLTVVRNGVLVSFDEENVTGFFTYYGDVEVNEFYNYTGEPYLIDMNGLPADDYPVHVEFVGNDDFASASDSVYVSVERNDPEIKASLNGTVFTVEFNRNATDLTVIFDVSNDDYWRDFVYGWEGGSCDPIVVDLSDLPVGNYSVDVSSLPNRYYSGSNVLFFDLTVPGKQLKDPGLNLTVVRNGVLVSFDEENVTGFFTYYGDVEVNEFYNYTGEPYLIDMNGLPADDYPVHVEFVGNDDFASASDSVYVSVERNDPEIKASLNGTVFTVEFNRNATYLTVTFDVSNDDYWREFVYGWEGGSCDPIVVDLSDLPVGNYSVDVSSLPDDYYSGSDVLSFDLTVPGKQLKDPGLNLTVVRNGLVISFNEENVTGIVTYSGDDQMSEGRYINYTGTPFLVDLNGLPEDDYPIAVKYLGNDVFAQTYDFGVVPVVTNDPELNVTVNGTVITITLNENVSEVDVDISVPDEDYDRSYSWGGVSPIIVDLSDLAPGNYSIYVRSAPDDYYRSANATVDVTVEKTASKIISDSVTTVYNGGKYLEVALKDASGNPICGANITVNLNGAKHLVTDGLGKAKLTTNKLAPKSSYNAVITFAGDDNYKAVSKTVKVTVKKATPKLTAKAKTFKKSVKIKKYTITLKTNKNKVMKNIKVKLIVNGNKYYANTTSNGKATFKINKLTNKGTFKATVKFAGNKYYNAKTVKPKITVK